MDWVTLSSGYRVRKKRAGPINNLKQARKDKNLSQYALSAKCGKKGAYFISKIELGTNPITNSVARQLGEVLEVDYRIFL